jgi:hypothetical protein
MWVSFHISSFKFYGAEIDNYFTLCRSCNRLTKKMVRAIAIGEL